MSRILKPQFKHLKAAQFKIEKLTWEELHRQLMYNPWTGVLYWKVANGRYKIGDIAGGKTPNDYIIIGINYHNYFAHVLAWFYMHGYFPENDIDHKDRIRYHNWSSNLREISRQCNMRNRKLNDNNTSGVKGVSFYKRYNKWQAQIGINWVSKRLGYYKSFDNAVCARLAGEQCVDWEGCEDNSPAYLYVKKNIQGDKNESRI